MIGSLISEYDIHLVKESQFEMVFNNLDLSLLLSALRLGKILRAGGNSRSDKPLTESRSTRLSQ